MSSKGGRSLFIMKKTLRENNLNFVNYVTLRYVRINIVVIIVHEEKIGDLRFAIFLPFTPTLSAKFCGTEGPSVRQH